LIFPERQQRGETVKRELLLLRHADSKAAQPGLSDLDRGLTRGGRAAAREMAQHLIKHDLLPDAVLCSSAERALQTWARLSEDLPRQCGFYPNPQLYLANRPTLLRLLRETTSSVHRLLLIGHHPGLAQLATGLAGPGSDPRALVALQSGFATGALASLSWEDIAWPDIHLGSAKLTRFNQLHNRRAALKP
tara:strand:- start:283 stop:855 length:573 start_codon:yes stop_codon:yes gene_type:complete